MTHHRPTSIDRRVVVLMGFLASSLLSASLATAALAIGVPDETLPAASRAADSEARRAR